MAEILVQRTVRIDEEKPKPVKTWRTTFSIPPEISLTIIRRLGEFLEAIGENLYRPYSQFLEHSEEGITTQSVGTELNDDIRLEVTVWSQNVATTVRMEWEVFYATEKILSLLGNNGKGVQLSSFHLVKNDAGHPYPWESGSFSIPIPE